MQPYSDLFAEALHVGSICGAEKRIRIQMLFETVLFYLTALLSSNRSCLVSKTQVSTRVSSSLQIDSNTEDSSLESLLSISSYLL